MKMGYFCINRTGRTLQVKNSTGVNASVVGTISPNEVFVWRNGFNGNDGVNIDYQGIFFEEGGGFKTGWLSGESKTGAMTKLTQCSLYDLDPGFGNGIESIFQTRYSVARYNSSGQYVATLPANSFVTTKNGTCGDTNPKLMHITSYGLDGEGPTICNSFINVCAAGMQFDRFSLKGTLR